MRLAILIATSFGRRRQAERARAAYLRETPGDPLIVCTSGRDLQHAWQRGLADVPDEANLIHFSSDQLEPHPGWYRAARADDRQLAAPLLWSADGAGPETIPADWASASVCMYPTLTREQLRRYGLPPYSGYDCAAKFVYRSDYAFTIWEN